MLIGIDQSFNHCGIVVLNKHQDIIESQVIKSNKQNDIFDRANDVAQQLFNVCIKFNPTKIAVEGLSFNSRGNASRDLAGLQFVIINKLRTKFKNNQIIIISPQTIKKYATKRGNSKKNQLFDMLPDDIKVYFNNLGLKKSNGLLDLTDAYWCIKTATNTLS